MAYSKPTYKIKCVGCGKLYGLYCSNCRSGDFDDKLICNNCKRGLSSLGEDCPKDWCGSTTSYQLNSANFIKQQPKKGWFG